MGTQAVSHNSNELLMDLVLVFLVVLHQSEETHVCIESAIVPPNRRDASLAYPFKLVIFHKHDRLLLAQMPPEGFSHVRNERYYD